MAGTPDVSFDFESKTELDFRNRLIAKFAIPRAKTRFWSGGFAAIPQEALYPPADLIQALCAEIGAEVEQSHRPAGTLGDLSLSGRISSRDYLRELGNSRDGLPGESGADVGADGGCTTGCARDVRKEQQSSEQ